MKKLFVIVKWFVVIGLALIFPYVGIPAFIVYFLLKKVKFKKVSPRIKENTVSNAKTKSNNGYSIGTLGYTDLPFTKGGNILIRNKYIIRVYLKVIGYSQSIGGKDAYECYCYDAKVSIAGRFASLNEIDSFADAKSMAQKHIDRVLYQNLNIPKTDFKIQ